MFRLKSHRFSFPGFPASPNRIDLLYLYGKPADICRCQPVLCADLSFFVSCVTSLTVTSSGPEGF